LKDFDITNDPAFNLAKSCRFWSSPHKDSVRSQKWGISQKLRQRYDQWAKTTDVGRFEQP